MSTALLLGLMIGAILGLTGAGGGILAVPALMASMGWSLPQAAPIALIAVASGASVGTLEGLRQGLVRYRAALLMAVCGAPFTPVGQHWASLLPARLLTGLFAAIMLLVALRMMLRRQQDHADDLWLPGVGCIRQGTGRFVWTGPTAFMLGSVGALTGLLSGLLGVGGGFVMVPLLQRLTELSLRGVIATSLMVVALISSSGALVAWWHGRVEWTPFVAAFAGSVVIGMVLGRVLSRYLPVRTVQLSFAGVLLLVASRMLYLSLHG